MYYKNEIESAISKQNNKDCDIKWDYDILDKGHHIQIEIIAKKENDEFFESLSLSKRKGYKGIFWRIDDKASKIRKKFLEKDSTFLDEGTFSKKLHESFYNSE